MTPSWAAEILKNNTHNRSIRESQVAQIAEDIRLGLWMLTPQTVSIATDGQLLDGQHRLMAVVLAQRPVEMMLATDCPKESFAAIDIGRARTAGDILTIEGSKHANATAAIIRYANLYLRSPGLIWSAGPTSSSVTKQEILSIYRADPRMWDAITETASSFRSSPHVLVSAVGAFLYLYYSGHSPVKDDQKFCVEYMRLYSSGANLSAGSPILALKNWQTWQHSSIHARKAQTQLACHIKAYKYWRAGTELKIFKQPSYPPMPKL